MGGFSSSPRSCLNVLSVWHAPIAPVRRRCSQCVATGHSGCWVVKDTAWIGTIVAVRKTLPIAYMVPALSLVQSISVKLAGASINLRKKATNQKDTALADPTATAEMPNRDSFAASPAKRAPQSYSANRSLEPIRPSIARMAREAMPKALHNTLSRIGRANKAPNQAPGAANNEEFPSQNSTRQSPLLSTLLGPQLFDNISEGRQRQEIYNAERHPSRTWLDGDEAWRSKPKDGPFWRPAHWSREPQYPFLVSSFTPSSTHILFTDRFAGHLRRLGGRTESSPLVTVTEKPLSRNCVCICLPEYLCINHASTCTRQDLH
jgi:hypothetical protein